MTFIFINNKFKRGYFLQLQYFNSCFVPSFASTWKLLELLLLLPFLFCFLCPKKGRRSSPCGLWCDCVILRLGFGSWVVGVCVVLMYFIDVLFWFLKICFGSYLYVFGFVGRAREHVRVCVLYLIYSYAVYNFLFF